MTYLQKKAELSSDGALVVLQGCIAKAQEIGIPQCIAIVDRGGNLLAFLRMDGARLLSQFSATQKAVTAASSGTPTGGLPLEMAAALAAASQGRVTNLLGGLPILSGGHVVGAVGVGSGTGEQDVIVARAGIAALQAALQHLPSGSPTSMGSAG